ncbi:MAG: PaaI family thioesterase [Acidimicrobiales bacterium]
MRRLTNEDWGFESNCFVCEPRNQAGLRIPFHHDEDNGVVTAELNLGPDFSGAPNYLHGGITLAVLDEAMAWATIALAGRFAVTRTTTTAFERPVRVGLSYRIEARVTAADDSVIQTTAVVLDHKDRVCASARAEFVPLGPAQAADAVGQEMAGRAATFLRPD